MGKLRLVSTKKYSFGFVVLAVLVLLLLVGLSLFFIIRYNKKYGNMPTDAELQQAWDAHEYDSVRTLADRVLEVKPFDARMHALRGFATYYIASAQTSETDLLVYIDDCIRSLRKAIHLIDEKELPRLYYILGKAYYQKGEFYYDLAATYLEKVAELGYEFEDLHAFRGMAYSQLGETERAISAFTEQLSDDTDEFLLYALAKNYFAIQNYDKAKMYLTEVTEKARDMLVQLDCKSLLAEIYLSENLYDKARATYQDILRIDDTYADAYYGLGVVYEYLGDVVRARAEWRNALKANPLHARSLEKLSLN